MRLTSLNKVDKGITTLFPPVPVCVSAPFPIPSVSIIGGEEFFHIHMLPLSSPMSPGSRALLPNHTAGVLFKASLSLCALPTKTV